MKQTITTRARLGFAVGLGAIAGVCEAELCQQIGALRNSITLFCLVVGGAGVLSLLLGALVERKSTLSDHTFAFLRSLKYWGMIIVLSTGGFYSFNALTRPCQIRAYAATEEHPRAQSTGVFPPLELQGLTLNGERSSAIINGEVVMVGEGIGDVLLVGISEHHAVVALQGQTNVLSLAIK